MKKSLFLAIGCLLLAQARGMAIPSQITYQGTLKQQGVPVTGTTKHMHFAITNADGSQQYGNAVDAMVPVNQGLFSVPLTFTGVDWQNVTPYIQVTVENTVLGPPEAVTATVYATIANTVVNGAIGTSQLASLAVTSTTIANGAVGAPQLAPMAVTSPAIANGAVGTQQLAALAVTSSTIANGAIGAPQLAAMAVTPTAIANGAVGTPQLAALAVTSTTIADGAITQQKLDASIGINPPGSIIAYGGTNDPAGWMICDGREINRTTYAALFTAVGIAFGAGNGTTTFNIPDFRGRFLRGQNQSTGRDPDSSSRTTMNTSGNSGDAIGSVQSDQLISHTHSITDPGHNHDLPEGEGQYGLIRRSITGESNTSKDTDSGRSGIEPDLLDSPSSTIPNSFTGITINSYGGSETRPVNAYVNWIIRY